MNAAEWFERFPALADDPLFIIRGRLSDGSWFAIRAYEGPWQSPNHTRLFCELRTKAGVLFPRSDFYVGIPSGECIDSRSAKRGVMSLFCIRPSDTDSEFFEGYTDEQLSWVVANGEELSMLKDARFGDG